VFGYLNAFANLRSIRLSRIHARDTAITAALDNCIGDFAVILDPRHDDYRLISQLVERALDNNDVVIVRYDLQETYGFIDRWSAKLVYRVATFLIRQPIHVGDSLYRIYSRRAINALSQVRRKHRYLKSSSSLIGYSEVHITVDADSSKSKKDVDRSASLNYVIDLVISNSFRPLRISSLVGLLASFISLAYFIYIIVIATFKENIVEGWLTTNVIMTLMFLMQFFVITILSEYVARILDETRDEPLYFIEEESTSKTTTFQQITDNIDSSFNIVES